MCCHICSFNTVSKGPEGRPKKISHWSQCHSVDTRLFCCRCATSASKNVVTRSGRCAGIHNLSFHSMAGCSRVALGLAYPPANTAEIVTVAGMHVWPPTSTKCSPRCTCKKRLKKIAPKRWAGLKEAVPRTGQHSVSSGCVTPRNTGKS